MAIQSAISPRTPTQTVFDPSLQVSDSLFCCLAFTEAISRHVTDVVDAVDLEYQGPLNHAFYLLSALQDKLNITLEEVGDLFVEVDREQR